MYLQCTQPRPGAALGIGFLAGQTMPDVFITTNGSRPAAVFAALAQPTYKGASIAHQE